MKLILNLLVLLMCLLANAQIKTLPEPPYLETIAQADTLVAPDRIYLNIIITEQDSKGKTPLEALDNQLVNTLKDLGIDPPKQLFLTDLSSKFKTYFLKEKDIYKRKEYVLLVHDAVTASNVLQALEHIEISNVSLEKVLYSKMDALKLLLKKQAATKAKLQAQAILEPLNEKVGKVLYITDYVTEQNIGNKLQGKASGIQIRGASTIGYSSKVAYESIEISIEKIPVEATVSVKFLIE